MRPCVPLTSRGGLICIRCQLSRSRFPPRRHLQIRRFTSPPRRIPATKSLFSTRALKQGHIRGTPRKTVGRQLSTQPDRLQEQQERGAPLLSEVYAELHSPQPPSPYVSPEPTESGFAWLSNRKLLLARGEDAARFLQGLVTNNVTTPQALTSDPSMGSQEIHQSNQQSQTKITRYLNQRGGIYTLLLNAQGRILFDLFLYPIDPCLPSSLFSPTDGPTNKILSLSPTDPVTPSFLLDADADAIPLLRQHLQRYRLRARVSLQVVQNPLINVYAIWEDSPPGCAADALVIGGCVDPRAPGLGERIVLLREPSPDQKKDAGEARLAEYTQRRWMRGVPEGGGEIAGGGSLVHEVNADLMGGVDFRKGCYVGQELTIRTQHKGVVRKRVLPVELSDLRDPGSSDLQRTLEAPQYQPYSDLATRIPRGAEIFKVVREGQLGPKRKRAVGKWIGGEGNVGLALCRVEAMTDLVISTGSDQGSEGGGGGAGIDGMRWKPGDEFVIKPALPGESGGDVRVQACVPTWMRERIKPRGPQVRV